MFRAQSTAHARRLTIFLFLFACCTTQAAFAQAVNATLLGSVADSSGASIAGAKVTATETNTGVVHTAKTNESGNYTFPDLRPGTYAVLGEHPGFKKENRKGVTLDVNSSQRVDLTLTPGEITETIEVSGAVPQLQTERADTGRVMEAVLLENLPMGVNGNFQTLLDLVPGTTPASFQHSQFFNASSSLQTQVNGNLRMGNNYQIEGIDNNERTGLLQVLIPPSEAIQMVSVSTTNHDPELGRGTGAVTNVVLKSGTNQFHGGAYYKNQNSAWDARAYFNPTVGHLAYNYAGGNAGGPVLRNKVFFFADYLKTMDHEANTNQATIPTLAFRAGDLSGDPGHRIYDPLTGDATGANRVQFVNNQIPPSRINPIATKILALMPAPNQPVLLPGMVNDYFVLLPSRKTKDSIDTKIDWAVNNKDRVVGRFSWARPVSYQAGMYGDAGGPAQGAFQGSGFQKTYSTGINWNRIVSPTVVTELRIGVAHYHNEARQTDYGKADSTALGIPGVNINEFTSGMVGINIGNFTSPMIGYSASLPWIRAEANIDIVNSWTKIAGNHTIKFGVDLRRVRDDLLQDQTYSPRGVIGFGTNQTSIPASPGGTGIANDMASFLLDAPSSAGRDVNTFFPAMRLWQIFSYAADMWQVSPRFTINAGLRWELYPPPVPQFPGGFSNYDFLKNELVIAGVGNNPSNNGMDYRKKNLAPRLSLAYRFNEKTVVRAGFGMSYSPFPDNNYTYNYPVRSNNNYTTRSGLSYLPAVYGDGTAVSFEKGFPKPISVPIPSNGIITGPDITSTYYVVPKNFKNPYVETWNLAIQRVLPFNFVLDTAYVGSHGVDTPATYNLNAGQVVGAGSAGQPQFAALGKTSAVNQIFRGFSSSYHALQMKLDRRFSGGLAITTSFTYGKAMSFQGGDDGGLTFFVNERRNYARADFDRTFNFVQSYVYQLPFGKGKKYLASNRAGKVLGGWGASAIASARTGTPFTVTATNGLNLPGSTQTAMIDGDFKIPGGIGPGQQWFDTSVFPTASSGQVWGNTGRNAFTGPGLVSLNASVNRTFRVTERVKLEFRCEAFNATNTAQFSNPGNSRTSAAFGQITGTLSSGTGINGTGGGRNMNLVAKINF